ncbi:hypothetical protein CHUAL_013023 [Chamberlinius hualienensis]
MLLSPHVPTYVESSSQYTYFKFFVPENIWLVEVTLSNCTIRALLGISELDFSESCAQGFGLQADSLPFSTDVNITVDTNFIYSQPQPRTQTYYYVLVASSTEIAFTIIVNMKECVYGSGSSLFQEPGLPSFYTSSWYSSSSTVTFEHSSLLTSSPTISPSVTSSNSSFSQRSLLSSRHSNQSVTQDWHDTLFSSNHLHFVNFSLPPTVSATAKDYIASKNAAVYSDQPKIMLDGDQTGLSSDQECLPMIQMARIKHTQDFTDTFLLQGKDRYTSLLGVTDAYPVILKLEVLPFLDIGGTLQISSRLVEPPETAMDQSVVVQMCISHGQPPLYSNGDITCKPELTMTMSLLSSQSHLETIKYIPFPRPGHWFVSFLTKCYNGNISSTTKLNNESEVVCRFELLMVYLNIRLQPCFDEGSSCGNHGTCEESHRGQFFFSTCKCSGGWRGWGCTDGSHATSKMSLLMRTILLTISNIFFIPPVILAIKRKFFSEALVYTFTMFFSTFYHACDEEMFSFCLMKYEVLQFCDFYSSILSFWVTLIALTNLSAKSASVAHIAGALGIALGVEYQRTSLWVFLIPVGTGVLIMIICWAKECYHKRSCYPSRLLCLVSFLPGTILALMGLCLFAFVETESNYQYVHSVWHVIIALSVVFLLPRVHPDSDSDDKSTPLSNFQPQTQHQQNYVRTCDDSELIDVNDYAPVTSDFQRLIIH